MAHEVFQGSVQLTGKSNSPTLERRGVILMSDGTNVEAQEGTPRAISVVEGANTSSETHQPLIKPDYAWSIRKPDEITFRLQARAHTVDNDSLASDVTAFVDKIREKPLTEWEIDEFKSEFESWGNKKYKKEDKDDLSALKARNEVENLLVEAVLQRGLDVHELVPEASPKRIVSPEKQEETRKEWEKLDKNTGRAKLTTHEQLMREVFVKEGFKPMAGGAPIVPGTNREWDEFLVEAGAGVYSSPRVQMWARQLVSLDSSDQLTKEHLAEIRRNINDQLVATPGGTGTFNHLEAIRLQERIDRLYPSIREGTGHSKEEKIARFGALVVKIEDLQEIILTNEARGVVISRDEGVEFLDSLLKAVDLEGYSFEEKQEIVAKIIQPAYDGFINPDPNVRREAAETLKREMQMSVADRPSPTTSLYEQQVAALIDNQKAMEKLIIRIISIPLTKDTTPYQLGFYEGINLSLATQLIERRIAKIGPKSSEHDIEVELGFSKKINLLVEGIRLMHEMNLHITTDNLENFVSAARSITSEHIQAMNNVEGVATCFRIIEEEYLSMLAKDKMITSVPKKDGHGNYEEMFGYNDESNVWHEGTINKIFQGTTSTEGGIGEEFHLEEWQRKWGGPIAKYLYNMFLRAPEMIAQGDFPNRAGTYARTPLHYASNLMDWVVDVVQRYEIGKTGGGIKFIELSLNEFDKQRVDAGWDFSVMGKVQGLDVSRLENTGVLGVVGYFRSWRQELALLNPAPFFNPKNPTQKISMNSYVSDKLEEWDRNYKAHRPNNLTRTQLLKKLFFVDPNAAEPKLHPQFNNSLGILLRQGFIVPSDTDLRNYGREHEEAKLQIREAIWERTAELNPLAMAHFLQDAQVISDEKGTDFHGNETPSDWDKFLEGKSKEQQDVLTKRRNEMIANGFTKANALNLDSEPAWNEHPVGDGISIGLKQKLIIANEIRLKSILKAHQTGGDNTMIKTLDSILASNLQGVYALNQAELALLNKIRDKGALLARDLGTIRLPFNPFMNDVVFETANYKAPGEASYKDALGGDAPAFFKAQQEFIKLIANPSGVHKIEEAIDVLAGVANSLGDPLGKPGGQDRMYPFVIAVLRYFQAGGVLRDEGKHTQAFLDQLDIKASIKKKLQLYSSWAQFYGTTHSLSLNLFQIESALSHAQGQDLFRKVIHNDPREDYKGIPEWLKENILGSKITTLMRKIPLLGDRIPDAHAHTGPEALTDLYKKAKKVFGVYTFKDKFKLSLLNLLAPLFSVFSIDIFKEGGKDAL
jgi:hypothetical protein